MFGLKSAKMKEIKLPVQFLRFGLFLYFLIPYLLFFNYYNISLDLDKSEFLWAFKNSIFQSFVAALFCVVLSIPMSQGLFVLPEKLQKLILKLLIIPQIFPVLYSVLIGFSILTPFPMGRVGIIFLFVLINMGFSTVLTYSATQEKLGHFAVISEVYSIGRLSFFKKIYSRLILSDLISNFFIIFIFCFSSFSVPLLVGGGKGSNLEVLIYEKIFIDQNWPAAFLLCVLQTSIIFALSFFALKPSKKEILGFSSGHYIKSYIGLLIVSIYIILYLGGYLSGVIKSLSQWEFLYQYKSELISVIFYTTKALSIYLLLFAVLLIVWLLDYLNFRRFNPAVNLISVSTVLVGFAFYLTMPLSQDYDLYKIILAVSILFFPTLFKLFLQNAIESLRAQLDIAEIYGLSKLTILYQIIFRQLSRQFGLWLSFVIIWFVSEFAILKSLGVQSQTLGLMSENFLSSYRLPMSYLMSVIILIYWLLAVFTIYLIYRVVCVIYKKLIFEVR